MLRGEELIDMSVPRLVETEAPVTLSNTAETTVLTAVGHASALDVWFKVPTAWELVTTLRLYARVGDARLLLKTVRVDESHRSSSGGFVSGTAISVRGRPVTAFELTAQSSTAGVNNGQFMMNLWHSSDLPLIVGGLTTAAGALTTRPAGQDIPSFSLSSAVIRIPTPVASTAILGLWHPVGTKKVLLQRVVVAFHGATTGELSLRGTRTTVPGAGTAVAAAAMEIGDVTTQTGLTTFTTQPTLGADLFTFAARADKSGAYAWEAEALGKPIILRAAQAEGFVVRAVVEFGALGTTSTFSASATIHWEEL